MEREPSFLCTSCVPAYPTRSWHELDVFVAMRIRDLLAPFSLSVLTDLPSGLINNNLEMHCGTTCLTKCHLHLLAAANQLMPPCLFSLSLSLAAWQEAGRCSADTILCRTAGCRTDHLPDPDVFAKKCTV